MQNVEIKESGIMCDNPSCDWKDESVKHQDLKLWLNVPCPKCGENVLTEQDFNNVEMFYSAMDMVNSMNQEDIEAMAKTINRSEVLSSDLFKDASGIEHIKDQDSGGIVRMRVNTHEKIRITDIKKG